MFLQTDAGGRPTGGICAVDMNNPGKEHWKVLVPERKDATIQGIDVCKGCPSRWTTSRMRRARSSCFDLQGQ